VLGLLAKEQYFTPQHIIMHYCPDLVETIDEIEGMMDAVSAQ
jgi:hypothetical protein